MKTTLRAALIAGVAGLAAMAVAAPAVAQIGISVDFGDVALAYQDGYYDSHHHWHHWRHPDDWKNYRHAHPEHYHDYRHDDPHHH